jgi:hypothetical protein
MIFRSTKTTRGQERLEATLISFSIPVILAPKKSLLSYEELVEEQVDCIQTAPFFRRTQRLGKKKVIADFDSTQTRLHKFLGILLSDKSMIKTDRAFAVISDVNGNLEALTSVLADIKSHEIEQVVFLGDAIGHGPNPIECIAALRKLASVFLLGRYEEELIKYVDSGTTENRVLPSCLPDQIVAAGYVEWLREREHTISIGGFHAAHAHPRGHEFGCLLSEDLSEPTGIAMLSKFPSKLFLGDNHQQWIYSRKMGLLTYEELETRFDLRHDDQVVMSVGSVGLPKNRDPRACYAIVEDDRCELRRVRYDVEATINKIQVTPTCTPGLADRLRLGI